MLVVNMDTATGFEEISTKAPITSLILRLKDANILMSDIKLSQSRQTSGMPGSCSPEKVAEETGIQGVRGDAPGQACS